MKNCKICGKETTAPYHTCARLIPFRDIRGNVLLIDGDLTIEALVAMGMTKIDLVNLVADEPPKDGYLSQ